MIRKIFKSKIRIKQNFWTLCNKKSSSGIKWSKNWKNRDRNLMWGPCLKGNKPKKIKISIKIMKKLKGWNSSREDYNHKRTSRLTRPHLKERTYKSVSTFSIRTWMRVVAPSIPKASNLYLRHVTQSYTITPLPNPPWFKTSSLGEGLIWVSILLANRKP